LRLAEEDGVAPLATEGKLYLTEEEWIEHSKKKHGDVDRGGSSCCGIRGGGRGRGQDCGCRGDGASSSGGCGNCHRCGKPRHWAQDCHSKQPKKEKEEHAFTTQEEESTLMFVKHNIVEVPDLGSLDGGYVSNGGTTGDGGPGADAMCVPDSAPHRGTG
jgi:hypothetical protein